MDWGTLLIALIGAIGGGLGVAIVTSIANRHKVKADAVKVTAEAEAVDQGSINHAYESMANTAKIQSETTKTIIELYETRVKSLCERVDALERKTLAREDTIEEQQKEITELRNTVDKLTLENTKLRTENIGLTRRLRDVEAQLKKLSDFGYIDGSAKP